jgi:cytochrome c-type biogenesis protein CcmH/NrfG
MSSERDRRHQEIEQRRRTFLSEWARREAERLAAKEMVESGAAARPPQPATSPEASRRTRWPWLLLVAVATLAVGVALGFAMGYTRAGVEPASAQPTTPPATQPASPPSTSVVVQPVASPACLETARRGDEIIALLNRGLRSRAADLLVAYTIASRQCRRDASP